jgi:hypothetical protein
MERLMKAFPIYGQNPNTHGGMDLRDYFAAKALQGFLANPKYAEFDHTAVECSYQIADAMMKAREQ